MDQCIGWTPDTVAASMQDVCVDQGRSRTDLVQQLLHRANVVTVFKQVCPKRVAQ